MDPITYFQPSKPVFLAGMSYALGGGRMSVEDIATQSGLSVHDVREITGMENNKPVLGPNETIHDLAVRASEKVVGSNVDLLVGGVGGVMPKLAWSLAAYVGKTLGINQCISFDLFQGCNSLNLGLQIAARFLVESNVSSALIASAFEFSQFVDYRNRQHDSLFCIGDAGAAAYLTTERRGYEILSATSVTAPRFAEHIHLERNKSTMWMNNDPEEDKDLSKAYREMYRGLLIDGARSIGVSASDLGAVVLNQGDHRLIRWLEKESDTKGPKYIRTHHRYGHVGTADLPLGFEELEGQKSKPGTLVAMVSSSIGFSWGITLLRKV